MLFHALENKFGERDLPSSPQRPASGFQAGVFAKPSYVPSGRLPIGMIYCTAIRRCNVIHAGLSVQACAFTWLEQAAKTLQIPHLLSLITFSLKY